jgi:hypothetical protein
MSAPTHSTVRLYQRALDERLARFEAENGGPLEVPEVLSVPAPGGAHQLDAAEVTDAAEAARAGQPSTSYVLSANLLGGYYYTAAEDDFQPPPSNDALPPDRRHFRACLL